MEWWLLRVLRLEVHGARPYEWVWMGSCFLVPRLEVASPKIEGGTSERPVSGWKDRTR